MTAPRPVHPDEVDELGQFLDSVFRIPRGVTDQHMLTDFPLLFGPDNGQNCRVIVEEGRIVSHAGLWPRHLVIDDRPLKVGVLVAVATHPDFRKRGQAAALVKSLQQTLYDEEFDVGLLWTGVPEFYQKLGWQRVEPRGHRVELASTVRIPLETSGDVEIVPFVASAHLPHLMRLHELEPVRMTRTAGECSALLSLPKVSTFVAQIAERPVAYLVASRAVNKPGVIECGGSRDGIIALLNHRLTSDPPVETIRWLISPTRDDLADWARGIGLPVEPIGSSKGMANEMVLNCRPDAVTASLVDRLFVWGLDLA